MEESVVFYEGKASVYGFENKIICVFFHPIFLVQEWEVVSKGRKSDFTFLVSLE